MLVLFTFAACEKDPFNGTDNHMLEFSLQQADGTTYGGEIAGNTVQLYIPSSVDKADLTAKYVLSELATVSPDPATVKDWSTEQTFTVTSFNGAQRQYSVKVATKDVMLGESVYLRTDKDVEEFAAKKIEIINGNLIIGAPAGTDSISNIDALAGLKEVRYKLTVNPTYKGDLQALQNLKSIGSLLVNGSPKQLKTIELPKLEYIRGALSLQSDSIAKIGFPALVSVENISMTSVGLTEFSTPELRVMDNFNCRLPQLDKLDMKKVETIARGFNLNGGFSWQDYKQVTPTIKELLLPALTRCEGMTIGTFLALETIDVSKLTQTNAITFSNLPAVTTIKLNELNTITTNLHAETNMSTHANPQLAIFEAPKLETVGGEMNLEAFVNLKTVKFPMLKTADKFRILTSVQHWDMGKLEEVGILYAYNYVPSIFKNLKKIGSLSMDKSPYEGEMDLSHIEFGNSISIIMRDAGITAIKLPKTFNGNEGLFEINLASNPSIKTLPQITGLEECKRFQISNAPGVDEVVLPSSLRKVSEQLSISAGARSVSGERLQEIGALTLSANNLTSMSFPNLETVTGKLSLFGKFLESIQLPKLTSVGRLEIGGSYSGWQNEKLTNLNFLSTLSSVGTLEIKFCKFLTDYSGLKKALDSGSITAENWTAKTVHDNAYNPTFEDLKAGRYVKP
ncbi:hypothetical protein D7D25_11385 [Proteiniphilum sp. X52]|nr:hypothetical protein D7D25_11385 [Proteiniphilum sp. X52]